MLRFSAPAASGERLPLPDREPARRPIVDALPPVTSEPGALEQRTVPRLSPVVSAAAVETKPESVPAEEVQAPAAAALSLADAEALALRNNPSLAQAGGALEAARGRWLQAGLYPNPVASYVGSEIGNDGRAGQQGAGVEQQVVLGNKLAIAQQASAHEVRRLEHLFTAQRMRVLTDVRQQFYATLVAQQMRSLTGELVRISGEAAGTADALFKNQEASRVDLLQAQVELQSAEINADNARNRYLAAWRSLSSVIGMPELAPQPLAGDLLGDVPQMAWEEALQTLMARSPELAAARANVGRAQWSARRAEVEPIPDVTLQASAQYDNASQDSIASVQIGLPIPLFNRNQGGIAAAQGELIAAQANVQRLELQLRERLAAVFERYDNARRQVARYEQSILPQSRESLELIAAGYRQGEFNYLSLLTAQRTFFQANLAYLSAVQELRTSAIAIQGQLLSGSLSAEQP